MDENLPKEVEETKIVPKIEEKPKTKKEKRKNTQQNMPKIQNLSILKKKVQKNPFKKGNNMLNLVNMLKSSSASSSESKNPNDLIKKLLK